MNSTLKAGPPVTLEKRTGSSVDDDLAPIGDADLMQTIRSYDLDARTYARRFTDVAMVPYLDSFLRQVRAGGKVGTVLDAGCGHGRDCAAFEAYGVPVVGLDLSRGLLGEASQMTKAPLVLADMRQMPFPDARFGGVWACASLVHLDPQGFSGALSEFHRVTRRQGVLFLSVRAGRGYEWRGTGDARRLYYLYDQDSVSTKLELAGYSVVSVETERGVVTGSWVNAIARKS